MLVLLLEAFFFTSTLVPLFLLFIYFSTASLRRSLMWNVLLCEIILGLAVGVWAAEVMVRDFDVLIALALKPAHRSDRSSIHSIRICCETVSQ
jgi:hypothetical protein